jgi:hypothetical protein
MEPLILRFDDSQVVDRVRNQIALGSTYDDLRDDLLFDFQNISDMNIFLRVVREGMNCAAHVCLNGTEYIENSSQLRM